MPVYRTVATTPRLDELIYEVASSIEGSNDGNVVESARGGITFVYNKSAVSTALRREYFDNQWESVQHVVTEVTIGIPTSRPFMSRLIKGNMVIPRDHVGTIIPIWSSNTASKDVILDVKSGDYHYNARLPPHTIIVLSGDSFDVSFELPTYVPFDMILHPKSELTSPEKLAT